MNIISVSKIKCTGCMECISICPVHCISIIENDEGFSIPKIDNNACINCGKCYKNCPTVNKPIKSKPKIVYAAQGKNLSQVHKSASGGIAYLLSKKVIDKGGVGYGSIYDEKNCVYHSRATTINELKLQRGSKYVQSDFSLVFPLLLDDCRSGREIIVLATPCQIAAVRSYLRRDYDNLLLVDLICHGVPSPKLFNDYLKWKERKIEDGPILEYNFRDKIAGWGTTYRASTKTTTITYSTATEDPYYSSFIYGETYRESCYQCDYACEERVGDITIGDYWGVQKQHPEICTHLSDGISCILINTNKGQNKFKELESELNFVESNMEKVKVENSNLYCPAFRPKVRDIFYKKCMIEGNFEWANRQMYKNKRFYINWIKQRIPIGIKKKIKQIVGR